MEVFFHLLRADYDGGKLTPEKGVGELVWLSPKEILSLNNLLAELKHVAPHIFSNSEKVISYKSRVQKR